MAKTKKEQLLKEIENLKKKRDKSKDTFMIVRLATKIGKLKKQIDNL